MDEETQKYLQGQIAVLTVQAVRDNEDMDSRQIIMVKVNNVLQLTGTGAGTIHASEEECREVLEFLSSSIDKTKSGGWIADRSAVYRVERHGREYRNTDLILIQLSNKDYNGAEGNFARARETAIALNSLSDSIGDLHSMMSAELQAKINTF